MPPCLVLQRRSCARAHPPLPLPQLVTPAQYSRLAAMVAQTAAWQCRVPVGAEAGSFIPFVLPLWGVVEGDHLHVDNRLNFALHADAGRVVAVSAYPVRDKFQFVKQGTLIALHGPVRWFDKGTYTPLAGAAPGQAAGAADAAAAPQQGCSPLTALLWACASAAVVRCPAAARDAGCALTQSAMRRRWRRRRCSMRAASSLPLSGDASRRADGASGCAAGSVELF